MVQFTLKNAAIAAAGLLVFLAGIYAIYWGLIIFSEVNCFDGQGSAYYIDTATVQFDGFETADINFDSTVSTIGPKENRRYPYLWDIKNPIAEMSWNCTGTVYNYSIAENGAMKKVDRQAFVKYVSEYGAKNPETTLSLYVSGNSPIFVRKYGDRKFIVEQR